MYRKNFAFLMVTILVGAIGVFAQPQPAPYTPRLQTFATGTSSPILIRSANDGSGRLFVVQQGGLVRVFLPGQRSPVQFIDLSSKISGGGERGLLGLTFHPNFTTNGKFYVNYTATGSGTTVVAEYTTMTGNGNSNTGDPNSERILFQGPSRSRITTEEWSNLAPTVICTSEWAMAVRATIPGTERRTVRSC